MSDGTKTRGIEDLVTRISAGIQLALDNLQTNRTELERQRDEYAQDRKTALVLHVHRILPNLWRSTRLRLVWSDVRDFATDDVLAVFSEAAKQRPPILHSMIALVYETMAYQTYANYVALHKPALETRLMRYLELRVPELNRLHDVREIDVELLALRKRIGTIDATSTRGYGRLAALSSVAEHFRRHGDTKDLRFVVRRLSEADVDLLIAKHDDKCTAEGLHVINWMMQLPSTPAQWGVDPVTSSSHPSGADPYGNGLLDEVFRHKD